jgi:hypothetical protein
MADENATQEVDALDNTAEELQGSSENFENEEQIVEPQE